MSAPILPTINKPLIGGFLWFVQRYLRKHFHAFAVNRDALAEMQVSEEDALVVYANHPSWWDPLAALYLAHQIFPRHRVYAPIDAVAMAKYPMFAKLGFFGVDSSSLRGAADFLRTSTAILQQPRASIWLTPEGRFTDPRDTTRPLAGGLSHLASKLAGSAQPASAAAVGRRVWFVPGAVEYPFWEERKPECLCWFGRPVCVVPRPEDRTSGVVPEARDKSAWDRLLTERLRSAQAELAVASMARDSAAFEILIGGKSGSFFLYDWWRQSRAALAGKTLDIDHSDKLK